MYPAPGYETYTPTGELQIYLLLESIYGLIQASLNWNKRVVTELVDYGFKQLVSDPCVFIRQTTDSCIILPLYVDDIPGAASSHTEVDRLIA